jgi:DNA modification methylase
MVGSTNLFAEKAAGKKPPKRIKLRESDGEWLAPVICGIRFTNDVEAEAYLVASNRLTEKGGWDEAGVIALLRDVAASADQLAGTGYSQADLDAMIAKAGVGPEDEVLPAPLPPKAESVVGRIYQLGPHRVACGDCRDAELMKKLFEGDQPFALVVVDPPYGVDYTGGVGGNRRKIANDALDEEGLREFILALMMLARAHARPGASFYVFHAAMHMIPVIVASAIAKAGWSVKQSLVWAKDSPTFGRSDYQWDHEPFLYGWDPRGAHRWLGDRKQTSVQHAPKPRRSKAHPTMKPEELIERLVRNSSDVGEIVADLCGGSGTALIACAASKRVARLVELDPAYCDVIRDRWTRWATLAGMDPGPDALRLPEAEDETSSPDEDNGAPAGRSDTTDRDSAVQSSKPRARRSPRKSRK